MFLFTVNANSDISLLRLAELLSSSAKRLLFFFLLSYLILGSSAYAGEFIVVGIQLNSQDKGEFFVVFEEDGNFLVKPEDLAQLGLKEIDGGRVLFQGEEYFSLKTINGVSFALNDATLVLQIDADPDLLPEQFVDMSPLRKESVYEPRETSIFFNYGIDYLTASGDNSDNSDVFTLTNEFGVRHENILFLNDLLYTDNAYEDRFVRLHTNFTRDWREEMQRLIVGDFYASSGDLGSQINLGGVSFSKTYRLNPYFYENPLFNYSGFLTLPSDVELYVDGVRLRTESLSPGKFELRNFESSGGGRNIEVVVRDSLGREQRFSAPFYFTDRLLRKNLHEYNYSLGFLRREFGQESNHYSHLAGSATHQYGLTDDLTVGGRFEGGDGLFNLGGELFYLADHYGLFRFSLAGSLLGSESGFSGLLGYEYRSRNFSTRLHYELLDEEYRNFNRLRATNLVKSSLNFGISYVDKKLGGLSFDFANVDYTLEESRTIYSFSHSRRLVRNWYLSTTLRQNDAEESETEVFINLSYNLKSNHSLASRLYFGEDNSTQLIEAQKNVPAGAGLGWRAALEGEQFNSSRSYAIDTSAQQNGRYGIYRGELRATTGDEIDHREEIRLSTSGAITYVGGYLRPTRPVNDSFSLVKVSDLEGVRVYLNSQDMGRTDKDGILVIPTMSSYFDNQISIDDKDIPIDYLMPQVSKNLSPPLRSGSCSYFPVEKYQAYMGQLISRSGAEMTPLEYYEGLFTAGNRTVSFFTGAGGEFYFDNDPSNSRVKAESAWVEGCAAIMATEGFVFGAETYTGVAVTEEGKICTFEVALSPSEEAYVDLGHVHCRNVSAGKVGDEDPAEHLPEEEMNKGEAELDPTTLEDASDAVL
ncbi:MAG: fimbria/pilus outer membrane usher protein [Desulfuromonadales bacterium]|nr:fimbria/pilus outer membrane usher protein [Desulfuromonadales bacterium]